MSIPQYQLEQFHPDYHTRQWNPWHRIGDSFTWNIRGRPIVLIPDMEMLKVKYRNPRRIIDAVLRTDSEMMNVYYTWREKQRVAAQAAGFTRPSDITDPHPFNDTYYLFRCYAGDLKPTGTAVGEMQQTSCASPVPNTSSVAAQLEQTSSPAQE
jgi:hypothetical protein